MLEERGQWLIQQCVLPSTQDTYRVGWRRWLRYASEMQIDPHIAEVPPDWTRSNRLYSFPVAVTLNYMFQLFFIDKLAASTISVYLAALRYRLTCANHDVTWMASVPMTKARAALSLMCRQRKAEKEVGKLPFTLDLIALYQSTHPSSSYRNRAIYTAMRLAHLLMMRVSEYTKSPKTDHHLRSRDVKFQLQDGSFVTTAQARPSSTAQISGVVIDITSAKNDSAGSGHRFFFARALSATEPCICMLLWNWAVLAHPTTEAPFFSYRNIWQLSAADMSAAMKATSVRAGLDPSRVSPHSLRYGGASTLAAANLPSYMIQQIGRWKSLAFLQYIQMSVGLLAAAQTVSADPSILTYRDVQLLHPGCRIQAT